MTLDDLCEAIVDCEHKTAPEGDGFALSVGTRAMKDGAIVFDACKPVSEATYLEWTRRLRPEPGDLILAREAPVGQVVRVPEDPLVCLGQRTVLIRPDPTRVHPRFLHYWLLGPDAQNAMDARAAGATVPHLNVADIRRFSVDLIPVDRLLQESTAEILGSIDDLIENNRRRIELLESMARAVYREWFVHFRFPGHEDVPMVDSDLGPIPEGWVASTCGQELNFIGGGTPSKKVDEYWNEATIPWYTPSDLTKDRNRYSAPPELCINELGVAKSSAKLFPAGSVMMTSRATLGVLVIATTPATTNQGFIVVLPDERWSSGFVREWLASSEEELAAIGTGATFKEIKKGAFKRFPFIIPEQSILDAYREVTDPLERQIASLEQRSRSLSVMRDLLLPKLVSGEIDVSELDMSS